MFEREGWDHERCRAYIIAEALQPQPRSGTTTLGGPSRSSA